MYETKKYMNKNSIKFAQKWASLLGEKKGQKNESIGFKLW